MPCQELFDQQDDDYKNKILEKNDKLIVSIEAGSVIVGSKYLKKMTLQWDR